MNYGTCKLTNLHDFIACTKIKKTTKIRISHNFLKLSQLLTSLSYSIRTFNLEQMNLIPATRNNINFTHDALFLLKF